MHDPRGIHARGGRAQGLSEHLATEDLRAADVPALPPEQVDLELLELKEFQEIGEPLVHGQPVALSRT